MFSRKPKDQNLAATILCHFLWNLTKTMPIPRAQRDIYHCYNKYSLLSNIYQS